MNAVSECPVCGKLCPQDVIVLHVERCLAKEDAPIACDFPSVNYNNSPIADSQKGYAEKDNGSIGSYSSDTSPNNCRKRAKISLASWCNVSPKVETSAETRARSAAQHSPRVNETFSQFRKMCQGTEKGAFISKSPESDRCQFEELLLGPSQGPACSDINNMRRRQNPNKTKELAPWADRMRPSCLAEFVGQDHILQKTGTLRTLIETGEIPSMVLWGPPGCGKTSLAHVIAKGCPEKGRRFVTLSATNAGVADVKEVIAKAKNEWSLLKKKTILFIDEIHRFNKLQQDTFLPYVENGTITLIGATTENPSFSLNSALLSRCRVFTLEKLTVKNVEDILVRTSVELNLMVIDDLALDKCDYGILQLGVQKEALTELAHLSDGDARIAINCLQLTVQAVKAQNSEEIIVQPSIVTIQKIRDNLQRTHLMYDRKGDEHYNCISALHKSMRGSDADAALYWLGRMLEGGEDPLYVARRLIRFASEDIGLADTFALSQAVAAYQACSYIGMPECEVILAQCVVYLAKAPKSVGVYEAYSRVKQHIKSYQGPLPGVPLHLRNAPTKLMKDLGYAQGYKYNPHYSQPVDQHYLPENLIGIKFLK